jgi:hypothetical protein
MVVYINQTVWHRIPEENYFKKKKKIHMRNKKLELLYCHS